jgi:hypothetical protein
MKIGAVKTTVPVMVSTQFNPLFLHSSDLDEVRYKNVHNIFDRLPSS